MSRRLTVIALSPPGNATNAVARNLCGGPFIGGACLDHAAPEVASAVFSDCARLEGRTALALDRAVLSQLATDTEGRTPQLASNLTLILTQLRDSEIGDAVEAARGLAGRVLVEVTSVDLGVAAERAGADGVVAKGNESGGFVGEETTFILLQALARQVNVPVFARGGVGVRTAAACAASGAAGVVLDWQIALCDEVGVDHAVRERIARMDGSETLVLAPATSGACRVFFRPGEAAVEALQRMEPIAGDAESTTESCIAAWRSKVSAALVATGDGDRILPIGQDACFARGLAAAHGSVEQVCATIERAVRIGVASARRAKVLRPGGPLAESHGTKYPVVQGPMTRVSDTAAFADAVATAGGLPFLALALLRAKKVEKLLTETRDVLGDRSWGVGILGFVPKALREEQLAEVKKVKPPFAIIAGGRPDQAAALEAEGIATYLHVPSPGLLQMFLGQGAKRVIFEGRECGGHVGPRSSFVLWESMIDVVLEHLDTNGAKADELHVLFAGGVHDERSSAMVAALAAPLTDRGVKVGVLMGTAYLFTDEAVSSGAIVEGFQREAVACGRTTLLETGVGHATRCADTAFGSFFAAEKRRLRAEGKSAEEIRDHLESLNLGRLRIASKGITRRDGQQPGASPYESLDDDAQRKEGMYMIGQVAALRSARCSMEELHRSVTTGAATYLESIAPEPAAVRERGASSDVAIVGMSCFLPQAGDLQSYWRNILNRVCAVTEIPKDRWDVDLYFRDDRRAKDRVYSQWGGFIDAIAFDPMRYGMPPNSIPSIEPTQLLVLEAVRRAIEDAGYEHRAFDRERTSVVLGAGGGVGDLGLGYGFRSMIPHYMTRAGQSEADADALIEALEGDLPSWTEDSFAGLLLNVIAGRVANRFDFGGTNFTVDAACASSLAAVRLAVNELETGSSDMVVVGGADTMQSPFAYLCFSKTQALSPTGRCRTFDESGDGIVISEGIAIAVLKRLEDAERDGDRVYAVIKGVGSSSDGKDKGLTAPRPEGQMRALRRAYEKAGFSMNTVGLIEAHGTGTVAGDRSEARSLSTAFAESGAGVQSCALGSVKSMIGHTKCTAGIAGMLKAALAIHHRVLPPTIGVNKPNPEAKFAESPFFVNTEPQPWVTRGVARRAGVSAFGFGGTNFHTVLEESGTASVEPGAADWPAELVLFRGNRAADILRSVKSVAGALAEGASPRLADLAAAACAEARRQSGDAVLAIVATSLEDLGEKLSRGAAMIEKSPEKSFDDPRGSFFSPAAGRGAMVGMLFPGQGSQHVGMMRDLAMTLPFVRDVFESADGELAEALGQPLSRFIWPIPRFDDEDRRRDEAALRDTRVAQPAMGATDAAMLEVLRRVGVSPAVVAGHSYGEYVALYAAGVIDRSELFRLSAARGAAIAGAASGSPGSMAAIGAGEDVVLPIVESIDDLWIANLNAPTQTVVTGAKQAVARAIEVFSAKGIDAKEISVSAAFHSPLVKNAVDAYEPALASCAFRAPTLPVIHNATGAPHADSPESIREAMAQHIVRPVRFVDSLHRMRDLGAAVFVEVGAGSTLSGLCEQTLGSEVTAVSLDRKGKGGVEAMLLGLAKLVSRGVDVAPGVLFAGRISRVLDVRRLAQLATPAAPRPTTWMVNGARAVPLAKIDETRAPSAPLFMRDGKQPEQRGSEHTVPAPTEAPGSRRNGELLEGGDHTAADRQIESAARGSSIQPSSNPSGRSANSSPRAGGGATSAPGPGREGVLTAYHQMMSKFLDAQKSVMLQYLGGAEEAPPHAASAPVDVTQAKSAHAPRFEEELRQAETPPSTPPEKRDPREVDEVHGQPAERAEQVESRTAAVALEQNGGMLDSPASAPTTADVRQTVLAVVADRTGYPAEMIELDQDLEADLGIDSIKRIEIIGALQSDGALPANFGEAEIESLSKMKTLGEIIAWIEESSGGDVAAPETKEVAASGSPGGWDGANGHGVATIGAAEAAQKPVPRMRLGVVDAPLNDTDGSPLSPGCVLITAADERVAGALADRLRVTGHSPVVFAHVADGLNGSTEAIDFTSEDAVRSAVQSARERCGAITGVVHLAPMGSRGAAGDQASIAARLGVVERDALGLLHILKATADDLRACAGRVVSCSDLGAAFGVQTGLDVGGALAGGCAGLIKSLDREWSDVTARVIDFDREIDPVTAAELIEHELSDVMGPAEVAYLGTRRVSLASVDDAITGDGAPLLSRDCVVLVTGGARGVTSECIIALARRVPCRFVLVGRSPMPSGDEPDWARGIADQAGLKQSLLKRAAAMGEKLTPKDADAQLSRLEADREMRRTVEALNACGATCEYHAVDATDPLAFGALIDDIYAALGRIDGVIHGAGVIEDKLLIDKSTESFQRVLRTKVVPALVLAEKLRLESVKLIALFSSVSGRYGNRGQGDYAAGNEILNKLAHWFGSQISGRCVAMNWGPWESKGGMVSAALAKQFEDAGVYVIPRDLGAKMFVDEVFADSDQVEVVYGGPLDGQTRGTTGVEIAASNVFAAPLLSVASRLIERTPSSLSIERTFDPSVDLYLLDHQLDGVPVVPMAVMLELFAEAATALLSPHSESLPIVLRDHRPLRGVMLSDGPVTLRVIAERRGERIALRAEDVKSGVLHYSATAEIAAGGVAAPERLALHQPRELPISLAEAYERWLFHGPIFEGITAVDSLGENGTCGKIQASSPERCFSGVTAGHWLIDPVVIDSGLQLLILWARTYRDETPLPSVLSKCETFGLPIGGSLRCEAKIDAQAGSPTFSADIRFYDDRDRLVCRMTDMKVTCSKSLNRLGGAGAEAALGS